MDLSSIAFFLIGLILFGALLLIASRLRLVAPDTDDDSTSAPAPTSSRSIAYSYRLRPNFLSPAERSFFGVLQQSIQAEYIIFAKVRLADIVWPNKNPSRSAWKTAFNRITGKHVDFILCDPATLDVLTAIELDDRSHDTFERGIRDTLVDSALTDASVPILRVRVRQSYSPLHLRQDIEALISPRSKTPIKTKPNPSPTPLPHDDSRYMPR